MNDKTLVVRRHTSTQPQPLGTAPMALHLFGLSHGDPASFLDHFKQ